MGRYYAQHDGLNGDVADAIEDHYKPRFAGDSLPRGSVGTVVALADKLETWSACSASARFRPATRTRSPCAAMRWASSAC